MNALLRLLHRICGRHHARLAARLQRDLTEYVLAEESRIAVRLHRAAWHQARARRRDVPRLHQVTPEPHHTANGCEPPSAPERLRFDMDVPTVRDRER
jgi:hypothetical protein